MEKKPIKTDIFEIDYKLYEEGLIADISVYVYGSIEQVKQILKKIGAFLPDFNKIGLYLFMKEINRYIHELDNNNIDNGSNNKYRFKIAEKYKGRTLRLDDILDELKNIENHILRQLQQNYILGQLQQRYYFKLKSFRVKNFKILNGDTDFSDINVIVGENNSGKTSFLQALYIYLKAVKRLYENIEDFSNVDGVNNFYIDKEFFDIISSESGEKLKEQIFFLGSNKSRIEFEGTFAVSPREEYSVNINIGYKEKSFYIQVDKSSIQNIHKIREITNEEGFNFLFIPNTNIRFENEVYLPDDKQIKNVFFYKLIKYEYNDIMRNIIKFLKKEANFLSLLKSSLDYLNIKDIQEETDNINRLTLNVNTEFEEGYLRGIVEEILKREKDQKKIVEALVNRLEIDLSIEDILNDFYNMKIFDLKDIEEKEKKIVNFLLESVYSKPEIDNLGQGYKEILFMLAIIELLKYMSNYSFIIMDEPAMFLHPSLKQKFANSLSSLASDNKIQIFYSTHDPKLIPEETYNVNVIKLNRGYRVNFELIYTFSDIYRFFSELGYIELINRNIDKIKRYRKVLFVEGISDLDYLKLLQKLNISIKDINLNECALIPLNSVQNVIQIPQIISGMITFMASEITNRDEELRNFINSIQIYIIIDGDLIVHPCLRRLVNTKLKDLLRDNLNGNRRRSNSINLISLNCYSIENVFISKEILDLLFEYYGLEFSNFHDVYINKIFDEELLNKEKLKNKINDNLLKRIGQTLDNGLLSIWDELEICRNIREEELIKKTMEIIRKEPFRYVKGKKTIEIIYNDFININKKNTNFLKIFLYDIYKIIEIKPDKMRDHIKTNLVRILNE